MIAHITVRPSSGEPYELLVDDPSIGHLRPGDRVDLDDHTHIVDTTRWILHSVTRDVSGERLEQPEADLTLFVTLLEVHGGN